MKCRMHLLVIAVLVLTAAVPAFANFTAPVRGQFNSSFGEWEFDTNAYPPQYNDGHFPFSGVPYVDLIPQFGSSWIDQMDDRQGIWSLGEIATLFQNGPATDPGTFKVIYVQVIWKAQGELDKPLISIQGHSEDLQYYDEQDVPIMEFTLDNDWKHSVYQLGIFPNPVFENIVVEGSIYIDEMIIDTQCIPEPASLAILGMGAVFLLHRKTRNRK